MTHNQQEHFDFDTIVDRSNTQSVKWEPRMIKHYIGSEDLFPLWVADMDFKAPDVILQALHKRVEHGIFGYTTVGKEYIESIQNWYRRRHDWEIDSKWLKYSPGIVPAVNFIIQQFSKPGDKIIIQPPVYYPFKDSIEKNGRQLLNNELIQSNSRYTMNFDELEELTNQKRVKMLILCSPHNPVGRVWTKEELTKLGNICLTHNILVLADEIHGDLIFPEQTQIPFASISEEFAQNSITCTAPTKTFNLAGLHVSNVIIPNKQIRDEFKTKMHTLDIQVPTIFGAEAMIAAYNHGEPWLDAVLDYIKENYFYFTQAIKQILPKVIIFPLEATYLVWVDFRSLGLSPDKIDNIIKQKAKLALDRGKKFGKGGEGFQRFNIACPRSILQDVIDKLETAFQPYL